jgi:asparagine synthase (glutamine-hydrolysing)
LDNRAELIAALGDGPLSGDNDVSVVAAAYERWGVDCFRRILGDWALAIWEPNLRSLVLAKDFLGTRHLYYSPGRDHILWSTLIDPLVLFAENDPALNEGYIAGWLSSLPAAHETPYAGILAVPPACCVVITPPKVVVRRYWEFDGGKTIRYRSDADYEEHFREVFGKAVLRRLRADSPILAELSGGMDSSSIVSMADRLIASGASPGTSLSTVSYYSDLEPHWNERPYFAKVEQQRGRTGLHIDTGSRSGSGLARRPDQVALLPGSMHPTAQGELRDRMLAHQHRVVLSGMGGDEVLGGVPTPVPELADLLARARLACFSRKLLAWALQQRRPWIHVLWDVLREFLPRIIVPQPEHRRPAAWLLSDFVRRNRTAFPDRDRRFRWFGPLPSFQENLKAIDALRRHLACTCLVLDPLYEKRYPFLDRTLLEFLYAIPREQLVRPGQRRSLMRRALIGIVPEEVLSRKRKAFTVHAPIVSLRARYARLAAGGNEMILRSLGCADAGRVRAEYEEVEQGRAEGAIALARALALEEWLESLSAREMLVTSGSVARLNVRRIRAAVESLSPQRNAIPATVEASHVQLSL